MNENTAGVVCGGNSFCRPALSLQCNDIMEGHEAFKTTLNVREFVHRQFQHIALPCRQTFWLSAPTNAATLQKLPCSDLKEYMPRKAVFARQEYTQGLYEPAGFSQLQ